MINRKEDQGQASIDEIRKEKPDAKVEWEGCDLGSLKEVKQVFTALRDRLDRCDLVSKIGEKERRKKSSANTEVVHRLCRDQHQHVRAECRWH